MSLRNVWVTGSSRGIGYGIAKAFVLNGDRVILNGCEDAAKLNASVEELKNVSVSMAVAGQLADLSNYEQARNAFMEIRTQYGPVEVLVNNAGAAYFGLFSDMLPSEWDALLRQNLYSTMNATHLVVPDMVHAKKGIIINISSVWGITGASCEAVYAAAKGAVNAFTKSMAKELGPSGIRINAIACGAFETRMNDRLTPDEKQAFTESIPLTRFGNPDEAGKLCVFLSSNDTAYLTGQIIGLDGGLT